MRKVKRDQKHLATCCMHSCLLQKDSIQTIPFLKEIYSCLREVAQSHGWWIREIWNIIIQSCGGGVAWRPRQTPYSYYAEPDKLQVWTIAPNINLVSSCNCLLLTTENHVEPSALTVIMITLIISLKSCSLGIVSWWSFARFTHFLVHPGVQEAPCFPVMTNLYMVINHSRTPEYADGTNTKESPKIGLSHTVILQQSCTN